MIVVAEGDKFVSTLPEMSVSLANDGVIAPFLWGHITRLQKAVVFLQPSPLSRR